MTPTEAAAEAGVEQGNPAMTDDKSKRVAIVEGASTGMNFAAVAATLLGGHSLLDVYSIGYHDRFQRDPLDDLLEIRSVLDKRKPYRRKRQPTGPTNKRAKVKAARKANNRRKGS